MNNIKLKDINNGRHDYFLNNLEIITKYLNEIFANSDKKIFENFIEETKIILDKCCDESITYKQRAELFYNLTNSWLNLWGRYKHIPEAIELGYKIDDITNSLGAYYQLLLGMSIVYEDKTGDEKIDLQKTIEGFQLIAETIDLFVHIFSIFELIQFSENAQKTLLAKTYDLKEYFKDSREKKGLVIQLRSYCSLIIFRVNEYLQHKQLSFQQSIQINSFSTINLSPKIEIQLTQKATKEGKDISEIAAEIITHAIESELQDYQETIQGITQGLEDFEKGNFSSCEDFTNDFSQQLIEDAEMLADIKDYDNAKNKSEESFPSEIVDSIFFKGENPIKIYREYRGISILELSQKSNIEIKKLEKIEDNISIATHKNLEVIAEILNIDVDMII